MSTPESLLQVQKASKSYGSKLLFNSATFSVNEDEHVGIIGPNGAGKSTLFRVLLGEEALDDGVVIRSKKLTLGYLSQHDHWEAEETGNSYLERVTRIPIWDLKAQGRPLQITEEILDQRVLSLSGGYRMRIKLLGLLGQGPNLMLLDEPTNYLDLETTLLLEKFLQSYEGTFLLISHDREFLRRTTDHILEIESGDLTKYNGNIDDYFEQKELLRNQLEARASGLQQKREAVLEFVSRFGAKATKARQAQSKLKTLEKMEVIEIKPIPVSASVRIPRPAPTGKQVLKLADASFGYGDKVILSDVSLQILRGDHVAVVGLNGAGKSTLLKGVSGLLPPMKGSIETGKDVSIALFAQHVVEDLSPHHTVLQSLQLAAHSDVLPQEILDLAGSLLFSGDDVRKKISVLSGGEKSRVALGRVLLRKSPCLILDEPTNHLDFQTVEALTVALQKYEGTLIVVSHDRGFVRRIGTKILEVSKGGLRLYPGTYDEYVWSLQQDLNQTEDTEPKKQKPHTLDSPENKQLKFNWKEAKKELDRKLRTCERKLSETETEIGKLQSRLPALNSEIAALTSPPLQLIQEMTECQERINALESQWLTLTEERETLVIEIGKMKV